MTNKAEQYMVPGLMRGLALLQTFDGQRNELSMVEIARHLGISRSSVFRLVHTLEVAGYLQRIDNGTRYRLGARVLDPGFRFLSRLDLLEPARPVMERLRDETRLTAHLSVLDGTEVVYVDRYQPSGPCTSSLSIGTRLAAYATTAGQVQLATLSERQIRILFHSADMKAFTTHTPTDVNALLSRLDEIRQQPAVVSLGRFDARISSCTAPVRGRHQQILAALSVCCPIGSVPQPRLDLDVRQAVIRASQELSRCVGRLSG